MLKYLVMVTQDLMTTCIMIGVLLAFCSMLYAARGRRIMAGGIVAGIIASCVMTYFKNNTRLISTGLWNVRTFALSLIALIIFIIFSALRGRLKGKGEPIIAISSAVLSFTYLFYALPDVIGAPYTFNLASKSVFSTDYIYRFIGLILGLILVYLIGLAIYRISLNVSEKRVWIMSLVLLIVNAILQITTSIQFLLARRIIPNSHTLFLLVKFTSNNRKLFIFIAMIISVAVAAMLYASSRKVTETHDNPAQHRKIRAKLRSRRRWATALIVCCLVGAVNLTAVDAYNNREVELAPPEECEIRDDAVYVSLEQVGDGHLHRFVYEDENGVGIRFIIIKKPNSQAYGVGLDACDICGETGYYERDDQVVCKLCDVVMNINTIGFKGGCNPIVIDYSVGDGYIRIPFDTLVEHEKEFA